MCHTVSVTVKTRESSQESTLNSVWGCIIKTVRKQLSCLSRTKNTVEYINYWLINGTLSDLLKNSCMVKRLVCTYFVVIKQGQGHYKCHWEFRFTWFIHSVRKVMSCQSIVYIFVLMGHISCYADCAPKRENAYLKRSLSISRFHCIGCTPSLVQISSLLPVIVWFKMMDFCSLSLPFLEVTHS